MSNLSPALHLFLSTLTEQMIGLALGLLLALTWAVALSAVALLRPSPHE